jgi:hypothetical protein
MSLKNINLIKYCYFCVTPNTKNFVTKNLHACMLHHDYAHIYIHNFIKLRNMILNLTFKKWKNQGSSEKKNAFREIHRC